MLAFFVSLSSIVFAGLLGNYANFILGAMGIALLLMLFEPAQLILKRRTVLQDIKRLKRLKQRTESGRAATKVSES